MKTTKARTSLCTAVTMILILCLTLSLSGALIGVPAAHATDNTDTWTRLPLYGANIGCLAIDPLTPSTLYASTRTGSVVRSTNSGDTWMAVNTGFTPNYEHNVCLAINPLTPSTPVSYTHLTLPTIYSV